MRKLLGPTLCKLVQRQTYTCLSSRYGIWLCIAGLLLTFISAFQFGEVVLEWSMQQYAVTFNAYHDNIAGRTFQRRLCLPMPVDVVYTWVNGTDPKLIAELQKLKIEMERHQNGTREQELLELKSSNYSNKATLDKRKKAKKDNDVRNPCPFANCVKSFSLVVQGIPENTSLATIQELGKAFRKAFKVYRLTTPGSIKEKVTVIQFSNQQEVTNALREKLGQKSLNMTEGFFTSDLTRPTAVKSETEVMILDVNTAADLDGVKKDFSDRFGDKLLLSVKYHIYAHVAVAYFSEKSAAVSALNSKLSFKGKALKLVPAMQIWTPFSASTKGTDGDQEEDADMSASRFADNQELKYSLRSIEKHAPWVRKIFIVTNNQIPSWLNLDNPRVQIVTHAELFPNASHLPTFSSPAIESHLHRIPGLSQKFIYMNDDVMFADDVWPDDFYTHSKGQKIFLTWSVPNCNEGCPSTWINDKYCDKACNVSVCDWDGGDCLGVKKQSIWNYQSWRNHHSPFRLEFCSTGCADTWVGDRYCDVACNVPTCGFDAGDCGIAQISRLYSVNLDISTDLIYLPRGLKAMYFNMSSIFGEGKITSGDHSETQVIRSATVAQKHKILTLTFHSNISLSTIQFTVEGFSDKNGTKPTKHKFNITVDTRLEKTVRPPVKQVHVTKTTHISSTAAIPTSKASKPPSMIYPVRIHHSAAILNYWILGNESVAKPAWVTGDEEYKVPEITNGTVLPEDVKASLKLIEQEFRDGDLTEKGYTRKKATILKEYLSTADVNYGISFTANPSHVPIVALTAPSDFTPTQAVTDIGRREKEEETTGNMGHVGDSHVRKLLWAERPQRIDGPNEMPESPQLNIPPTDDEIFVANWIADSKQKQLSFAKDLEDSQREWRNHYGDWSPNSNQASTSFLPWERLGTFDSLQKDLEQQERAAQYSTPSGHYNRKLMDTFADSLLHVHRIYNRKFGYIARKVPAHMPHMIDAKVMTELQAMFAEEFDKTSSHKLRSSDDMQFAFSYMYFVVGQKKVVNVTKVFAELDTDHSGYLSDRELRTLATRLFKLPLDRRDLKSLQKMLRNCSNIAAEITQPPDDEDFLPMVSEDFFLQCKAILKMLNTSDKGANKYKYETLTDEDVAFHMIRDNASKVLQQLDAIRSKKKKFVCLNDNIDHSKKDAHLIKALLVDFYESLFPVPSQFELPHEFRNRFLYMSDVKEWWKHRDLTRFWVNVLIASVLVFAFFAMFPGILTWVVQKFCPFRRAFSPAQSPSSNSSRLMTV